MEGDPDMDVEENSFMYPRIEKIYSDVNIKTEPIDIEEDDYHSIEIAETSSDYYVPIRNKIILGSKPSPFQLEPTPGPSTASDNWEDQDNFFECAECNLLFPTQNELDSHKTTSHSFLVALPMGRTIKSEKRVSVSSTSSRPNLEDVVYQETSVRRQKAVKSTAKSALNKTFPVPNNALKSNHPYEDISPAVSREQDAIEMAEQLLCKHCDVRFPDLRSWIKHTYELIPEEKLQCEYCKESFNSQPALTGHMAKHFKKTRNDRAISSTTTRDNKLHNKHVVNTPWKVVTSKTQHRFNVGPVKMKCLVCSQIFTSRYAAYKHKAEKHPEQSQKHTFHVVHDKPIKQLPTHQTINAQALKPKPQVSNYLLIKKGYIPKQNLFKCNKCQIHFVSCSAAFAHSKRCSLTKGDWKCNKCRRAFTKSEKALHTQQHHFSEKFKVHIVCDKILSKVLCRCPKCELLFDEISFGDHVTEECVPKNGLDCKSCDLKIHIDSYAKHMRYHNKYNFLSADFIIIDFVDTSFQDTSSKEEKKDRFKQKYIYCSTCNCHFYRIKSKQKFHLEGKCENLSKKCCTICGLTFSTKPYIKHMRYDHEVLNLKLNDIKFVRLQDLKVTKPVMPEFFKCTNCKVRFLSLVHKNNHSCAKTVFEKCSKCSKKYDSASYDIHLTFHNYGRGKTGDKKASPINLKFFSCEVCNYGFNSYDNIVEHCQKHYTHSEKLDMTPCKVCKLDYAESHKIMHSSQVKFEILDFDFEKLLTDDWLTGFGSLSKDEVDEILSKSIYGAIRNIRFELLVQGPAERTLYKCAQCGLNFEQDYVVDHTIETCSNSPRFPCGSCAATFRTRFAKNIHMNVHVVYGDDITFREIGFNNENDKELNEALRNGRQKESLKFRKCQQCKLLIKKCEYDAHISAHDNKVETKTHNVENALDNAVEIKHFTFRRSNNSITYQLFKSANATKKLYLVYKCKTCNASVMKKENMIRHKCLPPDKYTKCSKCSLYFLVWNIQRHIEQHAFIPKFIPKNITVQEFKLLDNDKNLIKNRRRYSFDDDASTCSDVKVSVSKTYDTRKVMGRPYTDNLGEDSEGDFSDDSAVTSTPTNTYAKRYIKKNCVEKVDSDNVSEVSENTIEYTPEKKQDLSDPTLDMEKWRIEMKNKLYQCEKCYMCFCDRQLLVSHLSECDDTRLSETPLFCDQCDMVFHSSLISFHEKLHELVKQNPVENYFYIVNISTNGVHTTDERRWLHKCQPCNVHYLTIRSLERHYSLDHSVFDCVTCTTCGLQFTKSSRTRHMRVHHEEVNWSLHDLHIEISHEKTVGVGEISLRTFVEPYSRHKDSNIEIDAKDNSEVRSVNASTEKGLLDIEKSTADSNEHLNDESSIESSKEIENNVDVLNYDHEKIKNRLYKCEKCSKHFLHKKTLARHRLDSNHKIKPLECNICGLSFGKRTLSIHKLAHHKKLKLSREDFVIINSKQNVIKTNETLYEDSEKRLSALFDDSHSLNKERNKSLSKNLSDISKKLKTDVTGRIDNHIYKCVKCSIFYVNKCTLLLHISIRNHKQVETARCHLCNLVFGKGSLIKHIDMQHNKLNLTRKDFIITDVYGLRLPDCEDEIQSGTQNASSIVTEDLALKEIEDNRLDNKRTLDVKRKTDNKMFKLYQCKDCKICVQKAETKLHVCCSDIQKKQCFRCGLYIKGTDVIQHQRLHRKYRDLSRKNIALVKFGRRTAMNLKIFKCVSCSTHFLNLTALEWHMNAMNHQTQRDYCIDCGLFFGRYSIVRHIYFHHNKLKLTVDQFNIIYVSDKIPPNIVGEEKEPKNLNNSNNTTVSAQEATPNVKNVRKLFKCVDCDVYFLTRVSYYHHIYTHRKLDDEEYVECNICEFQFLNESLGVHMKTHKDKSFSLDNLLIEEYKPNTDKGLPKVELYFAKESLHSKLVSTTTPFYNVDDKVLCQTDEQLSVIDSTSDEMTKASDGGIGLDVDANSLPHNSCAENSVNPIVELPNSDGSVKKKGLSS